MGGCQNYDPFLGTLNIRCRTILGIQKEATILTTTHMRLKSGLQLKWFRETQRRRTPKLSGCWWLSRGGMKPYGDFPKLGVPFWGSP